ncbi:MAG: hydrogenase formation protein HypD [Candidatus Pacebacteria bacterium]|nr:hydrogenase formation protein HypD [Candidatus Paceibacterota bacterium]
MNYLDGFRNPDAAVALTARIARLADDLARQGCQATVMEVCGTHTMAIARYAIRDVLPQQVELVSGPGCPVCVTDAGYIDAAIELARRGIVIATFGDMVRVPGSQGTLADVREEGFDVEVCYSPMGAVDLALANPDREIVFLAIGFETTTAPVVTLVDYAIKHAIKNLSLLVAFKCVPPALAALVTDPEIRVDAFLCPAHVSAIIGEKAYRPFVEAYHVPCVIAGFEPLDILYGLHEILRQVSRGEAAVVNQYSRVVRSDGNVVAQRLMATYLETVDVSWRGIGIIPGSGLALRASYGEYDATCRHAIEVSSGTSDPGCRCGDVLKGKIKPPECPLFGAACTPLNPVGPCMVSSEGSCAAYYRYARG